MIHTQTGGFLQLERNQPSELENALSYLQCVLIARRTRINPEQVTWAQYDVLEFLRIQGPMMPSVLSKSLGMSRSSTSKNLRILKDKQLINQTQCGKDKREQLTALTEKGKTFLASAAKSRHESATIAASVLTPGEQSIFTEICQKIASALNEDHMKK